MKTTKLTPDTLNLQDRIKELEDELSKLRDAYAMIGQLESHKTSPEYIDAVEFYFKHYRKEKG